MLKIFLTVTSLAPGSQDTLLYHHCLRHRNGRRVACSHYHDRVRMDLATSQVDPSGITAYSGVGGQQTCQELTNLTAT